MHNVFVTITVLLLIVSCNEPTRNEDYKSWSMKIDNTSTHEVTIQFYSSANFEKYVDQTLMPNETLDLSMGNNDIIGGFQDDINANTYDSSVVIFDGRKKIIFTRNKNSLVLNDSLRSTLNAKNYRISDVLSDHTIYTYEIKESDFKIAE